MSATIKTSGKVLSLYFLSTNSITFIANNTIIDDDKALWEVFNGLFRNAVKNLNIEPYESICRAIRKYENHPSVLKIKEVYTTEKQHFSFQPTNLESVIHEIFALNSSKVSPIDSIPTKILKENYDILGFKLSIVFNASITSGIAYFL